MKLYLNLYKFGDKFHAGGIYESYEEAKSIAKPHVYNIVEVNLKEKKLNEMDNEKYEFLNRKTKKVYEYYYLKDSEKCTLKDLILICGEDAVLNLSEFNITSFLKETDEEYKSRLLEVILKHYESNIRDAARLKYMKEFGS